MHTGSIWLSLRYSSPKPIRVLLALCAAVSGISFLFIAPGTEYMSRYPHLFMILPSYMWGALFCTASFAMFWRVFDPRSRIGWSRIINGGMFCLWCSFASANLWALGFFTPDLSALFGLALASAWATLRTDLTSGDRADA